MIIIRVLGIDQSTKLTGYSVFCELNLEEYGLINHSEIKLMETRFPIMCKSIKQLLIDKEPDMVVIEDTTYQNNANVLKFLSRLQGYILAICELQNIRCFIFSATHWRKILGFKQGKKKRSELKELAFNFCKEELNIVDATEDECEAICIGFAASKEILQNN